MKKAISLIIVICFLLSTASCLGGSQKESLTLYAPIPADPNSIDPQIASGYSAEVIANNCFEGLVRVTDKGEIDFGTAKSYTVSPDGLTYTFHLNEKAVYHMTVEHAELLGEDYKESFDNSVKAQDFVFAIKRALASETKSPYAYKLYCIKNAVSVNAGKTSTNELGVRAIDDGTLEITLDYKDDSFLYSLAAPVAMPCNEQFFNATGGKYGIGLENIMCNGPLYVTSWAEDESVYLKRNPEYFGKASVKASLVGLIVNYDEASILNGLVSGSYSCAFVGAKAISLLTDTSTLDIEQYKNCIWGLYANCDKGAMANLNIRKALFASLKLSCFSAPPYVNDNADSFVPDCCYAGSTLYSELSHGGLDYTYSEKNAKKYWDKGLEELSVESVTVRIACSQDFRGSIERAVQNWQKVLGISLSVKITTLPDEEIASAAGNSEYALAFIPVTARTSSADEYIEDFCANDVSYESERLKSLVADLLKLNDAAGIADKIREIEELISSFAVFYPIFDGYKCFAVNISTTGLYYYASENGLYFYGGARYE